MGGTDRLPLAQAERLALELVALLAPACERTLVAGSIRRRKPDVGDVELLAIPKFHEAEVVTVQDMFGAWGHKEQVSDLDVLCDRLRAEGVLKDRLDVNGRPAWGTSYKRTSFKDFALDLFVTSVEKWACLQAIRTGPMEFTRRMVSLRSQPGGFCPKHLQFAEGRLVYRTTQEPLAGIFDESDVFSALGVECLPPELRTDSIMPRRIAHAESR